MASGGLISESALAKASQLFISSSKPNAYSLVHLVRACSNAGPFSLGERLHCHILKSGFDPNVFVSTALINFYVKFDRVRYAHHLFVQIPEPTVVSWNSLISGYVHAGQFGKALKLFAQLEKSNVFADSYSLTAALSACGQLSLLQVGKSVHSKIMKLGVESSVCVANCLIDMYGKCGFVAEAARIFQEMVEKDTISWNSVIAANARNGKLEEALATFLQMPDPDTISYNELIDGIARYGKSKFTFSSILSGIARLSAIRWGSLLHSCVLKCGLDGYVVVGSALIDMYFKSGKIDEGERLFQSSPERNLITWNAMISGYAHNGDFKKVIQLFEKLKMMNDLQPNEITFLNVLAAFWHCRIPLKVANQFFETMINDYLIEPTPEHCCLMIWLMVQEGQVKKAENMIRELGYDSCGMVWKALLGACMTCGNVEMAEVAAAKVIELERDNEFVYVMMSNIYASNGKWDNAGGIREAMKKRYVRKDAGCS